MTSHKALVLITDGSEEMEYTISYDTLTRGGFSCTSALVPTHESDSGHSGTPGVNIATCSRGVKIVADTRLTDDKAKFGPDKYDLLVIPGGARGARTMSGDSIVTDLVKEYLKKGKWVGLICASVLVAKAADLDRSTPITSHFTVKDELLETGFNEYKEDPVVVSGKLVTTRGPGTTFQFALTLIELMVSKEKRVEVKSHMMFPATTPW